MADFGQFTDIINSWPKKDTSTFNEFAGVKRVIETPCGEAVFDEDKMAYICSSCFAVVGSVGACPIEEEK